MAQEDTVICGRAHVMFFSCGLRNVLQFPAKISLWVILFCFFAPITQSQNLDYTSWLEQVKTEALERGIKQEIIKSVFKGVKPIKRVLKKDRNQSEFKLTLDIYLRRVVTEKNVKRGKMMAKSHQKTLKMVYERYGVAPRVILAIWGIETRFGLVKANIPLIPSIVTLAYDKRRSKYFRAQLFSVLEMLNRGYIEQTSLFGSWAGAMGQPQFMPSSYLAYAQDFDGDGRRDIWNSVPDVLASIANYLAQHRWRRNRIWGREITIPINYSKSLYPPTRRLTKGCRAKASVPKKLINWHQEGIRRADGDPLPKVDISGVIVQPDGVKGRSFLTYNNYAAILSYNCAHLYGITVGIFSDYIGKR